jgi:hypothetical protein
MKNLFLLVFLLTVSISFGQKNNSTKKAPEQKYDHSEIITIEQLSKQKNIVVEESPDAVYSSAGIDVRPEYIGSQTKFYTDFNKNFKLKAENEDIKGRVFCRIYRRKRRDSE